MFECIELQPGPLPALEVIWGMKEQMMEDLSFFLSLSSLHHHIFSLTFKNLNLKKQRRIEDNK